jgi:hypothetical protein
MKHAKRMRPKRGLPKRRAHLTCGGDMQGYTSEGFVFFAV